jgi:hypothetical protein
MICLSVSLNFLDGNPRHHYNPFVNDRQLKSLSRTYSRTELARLFVPPRRAELFLERLANLDIGNERRTKVFLETFADLMGGPAPTNVFRLTEFEARLQSTLQEIWKEPSPLLKEAQLMVLAGFEQRFHAEEGEAAQADGLLMVLLYALKHAHLLRFCANESCKEPYFVARRGSQIYCSSPCAKPAQRQAKAKWWREHGAKRRQKSRKRRATHAKAT